MAKVRVYELARKYDISSEALIKILVKEGVTVKSHMSTVNETVEMLIDQHIKRIKAETKKEVKRKAKKQKPGKVEQKGKGRRAKRDDKRREADQKAVKESVKRTLAKLDVTRKSKRRTRKGETVDVVEKARKITLPIWPSSSTSNRRSSSSGVSTWGLW